MRYLKIGAIIFEIELCEDSTNNENDSSIINVDHALYETNKFIILKYNHIANNEITDDDFNECILNLHFRKKSD
jgi:hypothetical protein